MRPISIKTATLFLILLLLIGCSNNQVSTPAVEVTVVPTMGYDGWDVGLSFDTTLDVPLQNVDIDNDG